MEDESQDLKAGVVPTLVPKVFFLVTPQGLIEEMRHDEVYRLAQIAESKFKEFLVFFNRKPCLLGRLDSAGKLYPIPAPDSESIKVSSIALYAMVITYPRTLTRLIRRRLNKDKDTMVKGLKSIWVIVLILVVLFIIFMLAVTIIGGGDDAQIVQPAISITEESSPATTHKADLTIPTTPTTSIPEIPRANEGSSNAPRAVPIDE